MYTISLPILFVILAAVLVMAGLALLLIRQRRVTGALQAKIDLSERSRRQLDEAALAVAERLELHETLAQVCAQAQALTGADRLAVHLVDEGQRLVRTPQAQGFSDDFVRLNRVYSTELEERTDCLRTRSPMLVPDIRQLADPTYFTDSLSAEGVRGFADFPLLADGSVIGYLSVYFDQPLTFNQEFQESMSVFSDYAGAVLQNALQFARTETALLRRAHQLEILGNVGRELAAASHSDSLFELVLDNAQEFTNSPWGGLYLYDQDTKTFRIVAGRGFARETAGDHSELAPLREAIELGEPVIVRARDATSAGAFLSSSALSHLSVPMIHNGRGVGVLCLESPIEDAFTENDQLFINQLAIQAAVAVVNASLYSEARQRLQAQTILYQASRQLVGSLELKAIVQRVIASFHETIQSRASGAYLWDEGQQAYRLSSVAGEYPDAVDHLPKVVDRQAWEESGPARLGTGVLRAPSGPDVALSPLSPFPGCQTLALPLARGDKSLGLILSYIPETLSLDDEDLQLPRAIAAQGAIAMQNALLFRDILEGRDRLEAVLNSVDEGVLMVDEEERVIVANEIIQAMTSARPEDLLGKPFKELPARVLELIGVEPAANESILRALMQPDRLRASRVILPGKGGKTDRIYERFASPVWGQGQEGIGWVFVLRDVTEGHQLNQARDLLTETLVHDLRSPIGAVSSALSVLEEALPENFQDAAVGQSIDIARRSVNRVISLIESMLDISRMEAGVIELERTTFDLAALVSDLAGDYTQQANELGIILRDEILAGELPVSADREKVERVLVNLIDNALKFTSEGGWISVGASVRPEAKLVEVAVTDNGPGVSEEFRLKVFDRFAQVPGVTGRRRGSGLGLTFCRLVVEAHGGEIWVEDAPSGGSRFVFTLHLPRTM